MSLFLSTLLILLSWSVCSQESRLITIRINPFLSFQNYEHFKRLTLSSPDVNVEYIDGFEFDWGYHYVVSLQETELESQLSDGTKYQYSLNSIVSKEKLPDSTQFKLFIDANRYYNIPMNDQLEDNATLLPLTDSSYLYFNQVIIEVPYQLKTEFKQILDGKTSKWGTFIFIDQNRIKLIE